MSPLVRKILIPVAAIIGLLIAVAWMAGLFTTRIEPGLATTEPPKAAGAVTVRMQRMPITEPVPASVEAKQTTLISSRILARITRIHVRAGDAVKEGQTLVELEKQDLLARAKRSQEQIRSIEARLTEARQNRQRIEQLHRQGTAPLAELERVQAQHDALQADLAGARQALEEAQAATGYTDIRAPIAGVVVERLAEPGDTATPGGHLLAIYNPLTLRVEAQVREQLALSLTVGTELSVDVPSLDRRFEAQIEEIVPAADPGSRSFLVKARIPYDSRLLPGMFARLLVPAGETDKILLPQERILAVGQLDLVWVLQDGQAYRRFVRIGRTTADGQVEILAGLNDGDVVLPPRNEAVPPIE